MATDLTLEIDGTPAQVSSTGDRLFVEFPSLIGALRAVRGLPPRGRVQFHRALTTADLALEVRVRHRTVAAFGAGVGTGPVLGLLGVGPGELRIGGLLSAVGAEIAAFADHVRQFGR